MLIIVWSKKRMKKFWFSAMRMVEEIKKRIGKERWKKRVENESFRLIRSESYHRLDN
jgi:hypothetical protein